MAKIHALCLEFIEIWYSEEKNSIHTLVFEYTKKGVSIHTCLFLTKNCVGAILGLFISTSEKIGLKAPLKFEKIEI